MTWWTDPAGVLGAAVAGGPAQVGHLVLRGADGLDFLHRMSTAPLAALQPGDSRLTCFPDRKGRIRGLAVVWVESPLVVHLFEPSPAAAGSLNVWLDGFLFTEDVEVSSAEREAVHVVGAPAAVVAQLASGPAEMEVAQTGIVEAAPFQVGRATGGWWVRWFDLAPDAAIASVYWVPEADGALPAIEPLSPTLADDLRIAAGVPGPGELTEQHNPLELDLHDAIAWDKGCYPGQEVIARIDNYDKQSRHLVGLEADAGLKLVAGEDLLDDQQAKVGTVTSAASTHQGLAGLGLVRNKTPIGLSLISDSGVRVTTTKRLAAQQPHD